MAHTESKYGYPSVTEVLGFRPKPWLDKWREKWGPLAERKMLAAAAVGTAFHDGVERLMTGEYVTASTRRIEAMLGRWEEWRLKTGFVATHQELKVVSHVHEYEGTLDAISEDGVIYDWKTSSAIYPEMGLQLTAYAMAFEEMRDTGRLTLGRIVLISKDKPRHRLSSRQWELTSELRREWLDRLDEFKSCQIKRKDTECSNG